ncbi:MAG: 50S ribosomal protein L18 [Candidatus Muirbacterium halophilum]|nr:50S ribosomal protein L18 [Candidatus Muirbacterium halophilum]MCK9475241.1 50S ribosomal protein L18 [Candidatus Muirbacterium halophilum]
MSKDTFKKRLKRKVALRKKISGSIEKPRMTVFRSNKNISVQVINDDEGRTICSASTIDKDVRESIGNGGNKAAAKKVGEIIAKKLLEKSINTVVFDRNGFRYHGRIKELADSARQSGLKF